MPALGIFINSHNNLPQLEDVKSLAKVSLHGDNGHSVSPHHVAVATVRILNVSSCP